VAMSQLDAQKKIEAEEAGAGHHHHATPDAMKEVTAILVKTRQDTPFDSFSLMSELKTGYQAMAVNPIIPIQKLVAGMLGNIQKALLTLIAVIILVSGVGIFVSIYNSMSDRRREIGIMRALGAGRLHVFGIILAESTLLCVCGGLLGWFVGHGLAVVSAPWLIERTGLLIDPWSVDPWEATLFPILIGLAALVGFLPAMTAYRTNVADALSS
jgi:putative ABC transport system permease protein